MPVKEHVPSALPLVVDYANGLTQDEIARKHGLHTQTVRKRLKEVGVVTHRNNALTGEELTEALALLREGVSTREIGRRFGVAHTTILRTVRRSQPVQSDDNHHRAPQKD